MLSHMRIQYKTTICFQNENHPVLLFEVPRPEKKIIKFETIFKLKVKSFGEILIYKIVFRIHKSIITNSYLLQTCFSIT